MPHDQSQAQRAAFTLEEFIRLASKGSYLLGVRAAMATALSTLVPLPAFRTLARRVREERQSQTKGVRRLQAIYAAMTPAERRDPSLIDYPRPAAVAQAAGVEPMDVSQLRRKFEAANRACAIIAASRAAR